MLRGKQADFEIRFTAMENRAETDKETLKARLERELTRSLNQLKEELPPLAVARPPREILAVASVTNQLGTRPSVG